MTDGCAHPHVGKSPDALGPDSYEEFVVNGGMPGGPYLTQWKLGKVGPNTWLRVHHIHRSDEDTEFHDHPWDFRSLILRGSYLERTPSDPDGSAFVPGDWNAKRATDLHRLEVLSGPVITLVWRGPQRRKWGFQGLDGVWMPYEEFLDRKYGVGKWRTG